MDLLALLERDHREVQDLVRELDAEADLPPDRRKQLADRLCLLALTHSRAEEETVYVALEDRDEQTGELVDDSRAEHAEVEELLQRLAELTPGSQPWEETFADVADALEDHIEYEEQETFEILRELDEETRNGLAREFSERRDAVLKDIEAQLSR